MAPDWPDAAVVSCNTEDHIHLGKERFHVVGSPFMHQDSMVMVCAQASIWMALHYLHVRYGATRFVPSEITERAYRNLSWYGIPLSTAGLTLHHMVNAVAQSGYAPVFRTFTPEESIELRTRRNLAQRAASTREKEKDRVKRALRFILPYLESRLPVVLVLPTHAVCAIGHVTSAHLRSGVDYVQRLGDWVDGLIVHDDAVGPYRILVRRSSGSDVPGWFNSHVSAHHLEDIQAAIVPVPHRVHSTADAVEEHVESLLVSDSSIVAQVVAQLAPLPKRPGFDEWRHAWRRVGDDRITIRTYLVDTVEYLSALGTEDYRGFSGELRARYSASSWPRAVWITEMLSRPEMESAHNRSVFGEIVSDPTANRYDAPFLAIHIPGFYLDLQEESDTAYSLLDDQPYSFGSALDQSRNLRLP